MPTVTVSEKGWIVIPKEIRDRRGIRKGDKVHVLDIAGRIIIVPASRGDPVEAAYGMLRRPGGPSATQALLRDRRAEAESEERKYREHREHRARRP